MLTIISDIIIMDIKWNVILVMKMKEIIRIIQNIYHRRGMYWKRYYDLFESDYFNGNGNKDNYRMYVSIIPSW